MAIQELSLELPNRPGTLARVARILAEHRINLAAVSVDASPARGHVRLIVNDPGLARTLLEDAGYEVELREMIAIRIQDRAGSLLEVLDELAKGKVNVLSVAILIAREGNQSLVALSASDVGRARRILERSGFASSSAERIVTNADLVAAPSAIPSESVGLLL